MFKKVDKNAEVCRSKHMQVAQPPEDGVAALIFLPAFSLLQTESAET